LTLAAVGLAAVELGAQLVAAALPALGDLLDGVARRLEAVQLPRPGAAGRAGCLRAPGRAGRRPLGRAAALG
jgi:hypothetical protein